MKFILRPGFYGVVSGVDINNSIMIVYESVIDSTTEEIKVKCFGLRNRVLNKGSVIAKVWIMPLRKAIRWSFAGKSILAGLCKEYPKRLEPTYTAENPGVTIFTHYGRFVAKWRYHQHKHRA